MSRAARILTFALFFLIGAQAQAAGSVVLLRVQGVINAGTSQYITRGIDLANSSRADLALVVLNTPGGLLSSTREIVQKIDGSAVPVAVYVSPGGASATSAGTIIAMSAHFAAMAPGTNIGAAHPVGGQGEDIKGDMKQKAENDTVAFIKAQASLRGRNTEWAEQAIRKSVSATADEAVKLKVVDLLAADVTDLLTKLDGQKVRGKLVGSLGDSPVIRVAKAQIIETPMTFAEKFLAFLGDPNVSYLLMTLGGLAIYAELTTAGFGLAGILGTIALILAFVSFSTLPVNIGGVALILLGFALFIGEIFVVSSGILTAGGILSLVLGALFLVDPSTGDLRLSLGLVLPTVITFGAITGTIGYFALRARNTVYGGLDHFTEFVCTVESVDAAGTRGKVQVRGELWDFELCDQSKPVHVNDRLAVVERRGMKLVVKPHETKGS